MTSFDPRTPVLIGTGQISNRVDRGADPMEPVDLMAEALRLAEGDTGVTGVLAGADSLRLVHEIAWHYENPNVLVAERIGADPAEHLYTRMGGSFVQAMVNQTALAILHGDHDLVLLAGGEALCSNRAARRRGETLPWTHQDPGTEGPTRFGTDRNMVGEGEIARGLALPAQIYPLIDVARREALGLSIADHRRVIGELWARFSEVAAENPNAWDRTRYTADEIIEPSPGNRMVCFPYTKRLNSNEKVDQGAALIMCSAERARALGVAPDRWVFLHSGTDAADHWFISNHEHLHESPAMRIAGRSALQIAGTTADDVAHVDLYSCFPSAVQIAAAEIGFTLDRQLTVTGGMSFAGGPWNNYTMHGIATMVDVLRGDEGARGLVSGNGGYLTKHAFGVLSTDPPPSGTFAWADEQPAVDALPQRVLAREFDGAVTVEAATVQFGHEGPLQGFFSTLLDDGRRAWGTTTDAATMDVICTEPLGGRPATLAADGTLRID